MKAAYVENDADSLMIFAKKMRSDGIECDAFSSAEEAEKAVKPGSHDVLIIDIRLPGASGVELLEKLRGNGVYTPAVLITAFSSKQYAIQALNASANYLLEKPFAYQALKRVLEQVVERPTSIQYFIERGLEKLGLTDRENEVARLLLKGLSNAEIARVTELSEKTVKQYFTQIFQKAGVASRSEFFSHIFPT